MTLTSAGKAAVARSRREVWPQVEAAVRDLLTDLSGPLVDDLAVIETRLAEVPLDRRGRLSLREFDAETAPYFRAINMEWLEAMYRVEPTDQDVLDHPRERIVDPGGAILFVEAAGLGIVGACALQRTGEEQFELTKMGVLDRARGSGAGAFLLRAVIDRAKAMGARRLYLLSNRKSAAAIHLYERHGFVHDAEVMAEFGARYERCDVAMRYVGR